MRDNYAVQRSAVVKDLLPARQAAGVPRVDLPPYSPERNAIAPIWRHSKHADLPLRSFSAAAARKAALDGVGVLDDHVAPIAQSTMSLYEAA